METPVTETPVAEPSIADLRGMLKGDAPAEAAAAPAAGDEPAKTAPATEPDKAAQGKERGSDGKFKASGETAEAAEPGDETLPVNVQKRIAKAVRAQREAERKASELEAKLNGGNQESRPAETKTASTEKPKAAEAPKAEDFNTYEEYSRAISRYEARQEIDAELTKQRETGEKNARDAAQMERHKAFDTAEAEARKTHADYDDVTAAIDWPKTPAMGPIADYLLDTKNADLMYALGKQPDELARIAALPPVLAIAALGKFEAKLTAAAAPAPQAKKALPKPAAHVGGSASGKQLDINDPDIDMPTFKRLFRASKAS